MAEYTNQHYIPQTYLKKWEDENKLLWMYNKDNDLLKYPHGISREKIFYKKNLYTKTYVDLPIFTESDKEEIFKILTTCTISYNKKQLKTIDDYLKFYSNFSKWEIRHKDGSMASSKKIKREIESYRNKSIENNWAFIENNWEILCDKIVNRVNSKESISDEERRELIQFIVTLYFRNPQQIQANEFYIQKLFTPVFNNKNILEELLQYAPLVFKSNIQKFQDSSEKENIISLIIDILYTQAHICFYITEEEKFITCDNPVISKKEGNLKDNPSICILFPLTPNMLIHITTDKDPNSYTISTCSQRSVVDVNQKFKRSAEKFYIKAK